MPPSLSVQCPLTLVGAAAFSTSAKAMVDRRSFSEGGQAALMR